MKVQDIRRLVSQGLLARGLASAGFKKSKEGLVRNIPEGRQGLSIAVYDYNPDFDFEITACTRLEAIETAFEDALDTPKPYRSLSSTIQTPLAFFAGSGPLRLRITSEPEIDDALDAVLPLMQAKALPFLDDNRDVAALHRLVNVERVDGADNQFDPYRAMHALLLAHQAGEPQLDQIIVRLREGMAQLINFERNKFENLIRKLGLS